MPKIWFVDPEGRSFREHGGVIYTFMSGLADARQKRLLTSHLDNPDTTDIPEGWDILDEEEDEEVNVPDEHITSLPTIPPPLRRSATIPTPRKLKYTRTRIAYAPRV